MKTAVRGAMALFSSVSLLGLGSAAWAQSAPTASIAEVVVTGSRVISNGNNSPTPVTVQSLDQLQAFTPTTIAQALVKLPAFGNGRGTTTGDNGSFNGVANVLNLRNFGTQRNLILLDGMRAMPTGQDWTVDVTSMPEMLVQRVDVVTGGVSAVYGSDAVSGAVNYVLDHKFNGVKVDIEGGQSDLHDAGTWKAGIAAGRSFLDNKLHLEGSYEHYSDAGIPLKKNRSYGTENWCRAGAGNAANPYRLVSNCAYNAASYGGLVSIGAGAGLQFSANGASLIPFVHGPLLAGTSTELGGDGITLGRSYISASLKTDQAFGRADYDFGSNIHGFVQGYYNRSYTSDIFTDALDQPFTYSTNNPFLTSAQVAQLGGPNKTFNMYRLFDTADPMVPSSNTTEWVVSAGLDGRFADKFNWNLFYTHGSTHLLETTYGNWSFGKTAAALNAVTNPANGQVVCAVTLTNPTLYPGCTPINPFGAISAKSLAYAQATTYITTDNIMDDVGGTVSGEVFNLPAGPIRTALTAEYRQMKLANATPFPSDVLTNCTGLTLNCSPTSSIYALNTTIPFSKSEGIGEVALESTVPLLKDMPLARSLEINGAIRYANYSVSGQATTWKIGGTWKPIDDLTIRVTRSQDVRAPSLYDLFQPLTVSAFGWGSVDVHTNTSAGVISLHKQGNANLVPEVSQTWTVGGVYRPHWAPRLSLSVDYYNMVMNNAITTVQGSQLYNQICEDSGGSSPFCALIIRPNGFSDHTPANTLIGINGQPLNVALQSTYGADFELNYAQPLEDLNKSWAGNLQIRMLASYQPSFIVQANATAVAFQQAGFANGSNPLWKLNLAGVYTLGNLNVNIQERWKSGLRMDYIPTDVWNQSGLPSIAYTDLTVAYNWKVNGNSMSTFVTVQNLFDQKPRIYTGASGLLINYGSPVAQGDDVIGRYFTIGARMKF